MTLDPEQMRRVLINLIDNAAAAMSGEGTISIAARVLVGDRTLRIEVADDGPGLPPADRAKVFSPYFSTKKRGTGLGLAIVQELMVQHRGRVTLKSQSGEGSVFTLQFPLVEAEDKADAQDGD